MVVVSKKQNPKLFGDSHLIAESTEKSLELLKDSEEVVVAGGGILNNSFIEKNLIDEIYIDIEPIIITKGIPLFKGKGVEIKLELVGQKKISENEIQLYYRVIK